MTTPQNLIHVTSPEHFKSLLEADLGRVSLLNFWAPWAKPCEAFNKVVEETAAKFPEVLALMIEAESLPDISESFDIEAVPSFLLLRGHTLLARHSGSDASLLLQLLTQHTRPAAPAPTASTTLPPTPARTEQDITERCKTLMNKHKVMLFMKGNPSVPKCGFSRQTVGLLREKGIEFGWFDIFSDEDVRQGLKKVNDWPTFPQIIVHGQLIGGLDLLKEALEDGSFDEALQNPPEVDE